MTCSASLVATDSQETGRGYDTFNISDFDLYDTYLPAFESAFKKGKSSGLMCSCKAAAHWGSVGPAMHDSSTLAPDPPVPALHGPSMHDSSAASSHHRRGQVTG